MAALVTGTTWVAFVVGILVLVTGAATLARREPVLPWLRARVEWRRWGGSQILLGVFVMLETLPRLAHGPALLVLVFSVVAFVPLAGGIMLLRLSQSARP